MRPSKKRKSDSDSDLSIICQENQRDSFEQKRLTSLQTLKERAVQKRKARDVTNHEAIQRIEECSIEDTNLSVYAHRKCYAKFTNITNINRLIDKLPATAQSTPDPHSETIDPEQSSTSQWERSGSVVECLTRDRRAAGSSLTVVTALCP